jgi:hypothetical protein
MNERRIAHTGWLAALTLAFLAPTAPAAPEQSEEFVGPFPSWADLRREYHAVGDGVADDSLPFQRALDDLKRTAEIGTRSVLYVPAGIYRLGRGLTMTSHIYASVVGEDPERTIIVWDGPEGGVMLACNGVRYSKFGRLTWDGRGKARVAVAHVWDGKVQNANSGCEHADEVFKDVGVGLRAGTPPPPHNMDAECAVLRCRFERCSRAGIMIGSMNALDWWVWHCRFDGCRVGASNIPDGEYGGGHFHVYESVFRGSTEADMTIGHAQYFGIRNNTSIGSQAFFVAKRPQFGRGKWADDDTWGGEIKLQGNRILDPQDAAPIRLAECGPLVMLDNVIRGRPWADGPAVEVHAPGVPDVLAVGNTFTAAKPFNVEGRLHELDTQTVARSAISGSVPELPPTPPRRERKVFEVSPRSGSAGIQGALESAAKLAGQRPVVHLPSGIYGIDRPVIVPANSDVQIVGDGERSSLRWVGRGNVPMIRIAGPTHASLSDFSVWGAPQLAIPRGVVPPAPIAIVAENCDQPDGRVTADQVWARGSQFGFWVRPLRYTTVQLSDSYPRSTSPQGTMLRAEGSRVALFGGATSGPGCCFAVDGGGQLLVRDTWYEGPSPRILNLTDSGAFTLDGASLYCNPKGGLGAAPIVVDGFRGPVALIGVKLSGPTWMSVRGDSPDTEVLFAGSMYKGRDVEEQPGKARLILQNNRHLVDKPKPGTDPAIEKGTEDVLVLRALLAQDREGRPQLPGPLKPGVTNLRLHRVWLENVLGGGLLVTGEPGK